LNDFVFVRVPIEHQALSGACWYNIIFYWNLIHMDDFLKCMIGVADFLQSGWITQEIVNLVNRFRTIERNVIKQFIVFNLVLPTRDSAISLKAIVPSKSGSSWSWSIFMYVRIDIGSRSNEATAVKWEFVEDSTSSLFTPKQADTICSREPSSNQLKPVKSKCHNCTSLNTIVNTVILRVAIH
jgi:hypothetical protein